MGADLDILSAGCGVRCWQIENRASGQVLGVYEGATASEALDAMARDAGYRSHADAPGDGADLLVREVVTMREHALMWGAA